MNIKQCYYAVRSVIRGYYPEFVANYLTHRFIKNGGFDRIFYDKTPFGEQVNKMIEIHLGEKLLSDAALVARIRFDMAKCRVLYGTQAYEYFCLGYYQGSPQMRRSILSRSLKDGYCIRAAGENWRTEFLAIGDKYKLYQLCREYFRRDVIQIRSDADFSEFEGFACKHRTFMAKPINGHCGRGIEIMEMSRFGGDVSEAFRYLRGSGAWVVEELVVQAQEMARLNVSSVNTIRLPSFRTKHGYEMHFPIIRIGRAGSIVDNAGSGGVCACIDEKTGRIISDARDENGDMFSAHPDSGVVLKGLQIPQWRELVELTHVIHSRLPKTLKYVAFDCALTDNGWVLIEANWGELCMRQCILGVGLRHEFSRLIRS